MEEDGHGEELPPFWIQSTADLRHSGRLRRGIASLFLSSGMVVLILMVTAVVSLVFVLPATLSFTSQILKPNSVKKSWDFLNIFLVFVAVVFGFLCRNRNEETYSASAYYNEFQASSSKRNEHHKSNPSTPNKMEDYSAMEGQQSVLASSSKWLKEYSDYQQKNVVLRRNSTSYPDLRELSAHLEHGDFHHRKVYDDAYIDPGKRSDPGKRHCHRRHRSLGEVYHPTEETQTEAVIVDTLGSKSNLETQLSGGPPPEVEDNLKRDLENKPANGRLRRKNERLRGVQDKDLEISNPSSAPPLSEQKSGKTERKRGGAAAIATKDFFNSLYPKRKKKKQRQRSVGNLDSLLNEAEAPLSFQIPPTSSTPPLPPPPPPPSVFHNVFPSKKQKEKRTITVMLAPPHPASQTPPPPRPPQGSELPEQESTSLFVPSTTHKPTLSIQMSSFNKIEENSNSGGESPLNRIPPPPRPPSPSFLKNPVWKFVVQGDYVRVNSSDAGETDSDVTPSSANGGNHPTPFHPSPLFCPSPDVNTKAESFITKFRAKLELEKIHSMNKRETGLSGLGPDGSRI